MEKVKQMKAKVLAKFKKVCYGLFLILGVATFSWGALGISSSVEAQGSFGSEQTYTDIIATNDSKSIATAGTEKAQDGGLVDVLKKFVNWTLSLLSFAALVVLIYGGYLMVTAAGDDGKYKKGFTILKQAAIGLAVIGLAWFIVSIVFWLVTNTTK